MSSAPSLVRGFLLIGVLSSPAAVLGWGETGHRVVCQIAYEELHPAARRELDRLLALDPDFDQFADACLFADEPERIRWRDHFINMPRSARAITVFECPMAETCILPAIHSDYLRLLDPRTPDADRLLAVKLLGHWVGDVHQPLHVSFQDDRGANSNRIVGEDEEANLHGIWDYRIISQCMGEDFKQIARRLRRDVSDDQREAWRFDSPVEWANESFQITISPATEYCVLKQGACWYSVDNMLLNDGEVWRSFVIGGDYLRRQSPMVALRLQQAGIRLGELLNRAFVGSP